MSGSGCQRGQLHKIAAVQRELCHFLRSDNLAKRRIRSFDRYGIGRYFNCRTHAGNRKRKIQLPVLIHLQSDVLGFRGLKPLIFYVNRVNRNRQQIHTVVTCFVGLRIASHSGRLRRHFDRCPSYSRSRFIRDCAGDTPCRLAKRLLSPAQTNHAANDHRTNNTLAHSPHPSRQPTRTLLDSLRKRKKRTVICSPGAIGSSPNHTWN